MIRQYNNRTVQVENGVTKYLADIFCNSTDTKPTANLVNGSKLTEVDTGKTYLYDEGGSEWVEYSAGGGGGGVMVTLTNPQPVSETLFYFDASMLAGEIAEKVLSGTPVYVTFDLRGFGMNYAYILPIDTVKYLNGSVEWVEGEHITYDSTSIDSRFQIQILSEPSGSPAHSAQANIIA